MNELNSRRMDQVLIGADSSHGRELVYQSKIALSYHMSPSSVQITKIEPLVTGMKEQVVREMQR